MDEKLIPVFSKKILPYYGYYLENRFVLTNLCKKTYDHYMWHKHLYGKHTLGWHPTIVEIDSFEVEQSEQTRSKILGSYCYLNFTLDWDDDLDKFIRFYKDLKVAEVKTPHGSHPLLGINSRVYLVNVIYKTRDRQCLKFQPKFEEDPFGPTPETQIIPLKVPKNHVFSTNPDLEASGDQVTPQHLSMYQQFLAYGTKYLQESGMLDFFYKEFRGVQNTDSNRCGEFYYISFQPYYHNLFASLRPMKITGRCIIIPKRDFYYYYLTSPQTIPADYLKTVQEVMLHSENFNQGNLCNFMKNITFEKKCDLTLCPDYISQYWMCTLLDKSLFPYLFDERSEQFAAKNLTLDRLKEDKATFKLNLVNTYVYFQQNSLTDTTGYTTDFTAFRKVKCSQAILKTRYFKSIGHYCKPIYRQEVSKFLSFYDISSLKLKDFQASEEICKEQDYEFIEYLERNKAKHGKSVIVNYSGLCCDRWNIIIPLESVTYHESVFKPCLKKLMIPAQTTRISFTQSNKFYISRAIQYIQNLKRYFPDSEIELLVKTPRKELVWKALEPFAQEWFRP